MGNVVRAIPHAAPQPHGSHSGRSKPLKMQQQRFAAQQVIFFCLFVFLFFFLHSISSRRPTRNERHAEVTRSTINHVFFCFWFSSGGQERRRSTGEPAAEGVETEPRRPARRLQSVANGRRSDADVDAGPARRPDRRRRQPIDASVVDDGGGGGGGGVAILIAPPPPTTSTSSTTPTTRAPLSTRLAKKMTIQLAIPSETIFEALYRPEVTGEPDFVARGRFHRV